MTQQLAVRGKTEVIFSSALTFTVVSAVLAVTDWFNNGPDFFDTVVENLIVISVIVGAIVAIITGVLKIRKWWKVIRDRFENFFDDFYGVPGRPEAGVPPRLGVMARLAEADESRVRIEQTVATVIDGQEVGTALLRGIQSDVKQTNERVDYEMSTNGGGSLRDEVRTIAVDLDTTKKEIAAVKESAKTAADTVKKLDDRLSDIEEIETGGK